MRLFGCPDFISLTQTFLMARNFFGIFTKNNPAQGTGKKYNIPDVILLKGMLKYSIISEKTLTNMHIYKKVPRL